VSAASSTSWLRLPHEQHGVSAAGRRPSRRTDRMNVLEGHGSPWPMHGNRASTPSGWQPRNHVGHHAIAVRLEPVHLPVHVETHDIAPVVALEVPPGGQSSSLAGAPLGDLSRPGSRGSCRRLEINERDDFVDVRPQRAEAGAARAAEAIHRADQTPDALAQ